jgi:hypothetical protein
VSAELRVLLTYSDFTRIGILVVLVPLFQSEIAPPATRGFLVAQHGKLAKSV